MQALLRGVKSCYSIAVPRKKNSVLALAAPDIKHLVRLNWWLHTHYFIAEIIRLQAPVVALGVVTIIIVRNRLRRIPEQRVNGNIQHSRKPREKIKQG